MPPHIEAAQGSNEIAVEKLAKPTVLQTAVRHSLACGYVASC